MDSEKMSEDRHGDEVKDQDTTETKVTENSKTLSENSAGDVTVENLSLSDTACAPDVSNSEGKQCLPNEEDIQSTEDSGESNRLENNVSDGETRLDEDKNTDNNADGTEKNVNKDDNESKDDDEDEDSETESSSEEEYESAEEGEEVKVDAQNLQEMEDSLTDEQKQERREEAQVYKNLGNEMFRNGSYKTAIKEYCRALRLCPLKFAKDRAVLYSNRAACKMRLDENEGCIKDCSKALELNPSYLKAIVRRAEIYEKTEKLDEALADYQKIVEMDPTQHSARAACMRLPDQINERNEKLKEEMMGKLKDLGNLILRPFGLSTNNFKLNQDPNSGGYSVNFVQNPDQNQ